MTMSLELKDVQQRLLTVCQEIRRPKSIIIGQLLCAKTKDSSLSCTHWKFWLPPKTPEAESKVLCKHGNSTVISSFTIDYIPSGRNLDKRETDLHLAKW